MFRKLNIGSTITCINMYFHISHYSAFNFMTFVQNMESSKNDIAKILMRFFMRHTSFLLSFLYTAHCLDMQSMCLLYITIVGSTFTFSWSKYWHAFLRNHKSDIKAFWIWSEENYNHRQWISYLLCVLLACWWFYNPVMGFQRCSDILFDKNHVQYVFVYIGMLILDWLRSWFACDDRVWL